MLIPTQCVGLVTARDPPRAFHPAAGLAILFVMTEPRFAYPLMLNLAGRRAVVVGGGKVALRKAQALAEAGAKVRVVSPQFLPEFASDNRLECVAEVYDARHLAGALVVIAATDDAAVNARVAADARKAGALVNVVDRPALCDFIVPATIERGRLRIAISTGGAAPSLARKLRERLQRQFGPEYATYLDVMDEVRKDLLARDLPADLRRRIFERLSEDDIIAAARGGAEALRAATKAAVKAMLSVE
jgi:precorrin-2 dehydrogenase / sirohydrochlorin ferrochelatase